MDISRFLGFVKSKRLGLFSLVIFSFFLVFFWVVSKNNPMLKRIFSETASGQSCWTPPAGGGGTGCNGGGGTSCGGCSAGSCGCSSSTCGGAGGGGY